MNEFSKRGVLMDSNKCDRHGKLRALEDLYKLRYLMCKSWELMNNICGFTRTRFKDKHYGYIIGMNNIIDKWINDLEKEFGIDD
jgi:hypothetical protein